MTSYSPRRAKQAPYKSGGGRNRTHPTGETRHTRVEDEGGHQTPCTSAVEASGVNVTALFEQVAVERSTLLLPARGVGGQLMVKKLLILVVLAALGALVAKKVREA